MLSPTGDHAHFYLRIVRVYPERYRPGDEAKFVNEERAKTGEPLLTEAQFVDRTVRFSAERGYPSGTVAKVVMVSRFGDCGLTRDLRSKQGYDLRLYPECLEIVADEDAAKLLRDFDAGRLNGEHGPKKHLSLAEKRRRS